MAIKYECDVCHLPTDQPVEPLLGMKHGGQILEIKIGIHRLGEGHQCLSCVRKQLLDIASFGIIVGKRITLPEDMKPLVASEVKRESWSLRDK